MHAFTQDRGIPADPALAAGLGWAVSSLRLQFCALIFYPGAG